MKILSLYRNPHLLEQANIYCYEKWNKIHEYFSNNANKSILSEKLPQTWLLMGKKDDKEALGFYQLNESVALTQKSNLSPFLTSLFVDPLFRGGFGVGEMLLQHAKAETAKLGYDKLYLATDHINYYEKYGFDEIGLDNFTWGRPTKLYRAYTPVRVAYSFYDKSNAVPDEVYLSLAQILNWHIDENPATLLHWTRYMYKPENHSAKWFKIIATIKNEVVGMVNFMQNPENADSWYHGDLFVAPSQRRNKIGSTLIQRGIEHLRLYGSSEETLLTYIEPDNTASILLHKKLGFQSLKVFEPFPELVFSDQTIAFMLKI